MLLLNIFKKIFFFINIHCNLNSSSNLHNHFTSQEKLQQLYEQGNLTTKEIEFFTNLFLNQNKDQVTITALLGEIEFLKRFIIENQNTSGENTSVKNTSVKNTSVEPLTNDQNNFLKLLKKINTSETKLEPIEEEQEEGLESIEEEKEEGLESIEEEQEQEKEQAKKAQAKKEKKEKKEKVAQAKKAQAKKEKKEKVAQAQVIQENIKNKIIEYFMNNDLHYDSLNLLELYKNFIEICQNPSCKKQKTRMLNIINNFLEEPNKEKIKLIALISRLHNNCCIYNCFYQNGTSPLLPSFNSLINLTNHNSAKIPPFNSFSQKMILKKKYHLLSRQAPQNHDERQAPQNHDEDEKKEKNSPFKTKKIKKEY